VVKATGDGYLVCIEIDKAAFLPEPPAFYKTLICEMAVTVWNLTRSSELNDPLGKFATFTRYFLKSAGDEIGYNWSIVRKRKNNKVNAYGAWNTPFRVAGALSLGYTVFVNDESTRSDPDRRDASGYGVNLAFRLCDIAGRTKDSKYGETPAVLLDRRVGLALLEQKARRGRKWKILPLHQKLDMSGIAEDWAYGMQPSRE
jgi:class 3 adenylate cyclase